MAALDILLVTFYAAIHVALERTVLRIEYFPYIGPNWRSDKTVVEIRMDFGDGEKDGFTENIDDAADVLVSNGILTQDEPYLSQPLPGDRQTWCASLLAQTALLFQRKTGHKVDFFEVLDIDKTGIQVVVLEYEQGDVGLTAVKLAWEFLSGQRKMLTAPFEQFTGFSRDRLLPADTAALMAAARRRGIPVFHLERGPFSRRRFDKLTKGQCVRRNALLMLGSGIHQQVMDGYFCISRFERLQQLRQSIGRRWEYLQTLRMPKLSGDGSEARQAQHIDLAMIHGSVIAALEQPGGSLLAIGDIPAPVIQSASTLHETLDQAPMLVSVQLREPAGAVIDFDLAPRLDEVFGHLDCHQELLDSAAEALLDKLFAPGSESGIPVIAVTGTNGKTTTTRMIDHILRTAGYKTGMVCTDGLFIDGEKEREGDMGTIIGHGEMLTRPGLDAAVLETHHRGILRRGFAFQACDVGVCLNVSDDHLGQELIETVEQMAKVKRAVPERASKVAVLNADDPHCWAMVSAMQAKTVCLVSRMSGIDELRAKADERVKAFCVTEKQEGQTWIVMYSENERSQVIPVSAIPATFDGTAGFNVSNAMHAISATFLLGTTADVIQRALSGFRPDSSMAPGRMNVFDDLPFRIIMDFAHNPDGMRNVCEFVDQQAVAGRKVLAFSGDTSRRDETIRQVGRMVAGHFDFYFCKDYVLVEGKPNRTVTQLLVEGLLEKGVERGSIAVKTSGKPVIFEIFDDCRPGDLLIMLMGHVEKHQLPGYIHEYAKK